MTRTVNNYCANLYLFYFIFDYLLLLLLPIISYMLSSSMNLCNYTNILIDYFGYLLFSFWIIYIFASIIISFLGFGTNSSFNFTITSFKYNLFIIVDHLLSLPYTLVLSYKFILYNLKIKCMLTLQTPNINILTLENLYINITIWICLIIFYSTTIRIIFFRSLIKDLYYQKDTNQ